MVTSKRNLNDLKNQQFDVVIIGGGISGAWLALHCVQQGYSTVLIEKHDYASQTSSSSSKLLHGGVRYLQKMQFGKVRESAFERAEYIYAAPHLSTPVPFVVPTFKDFPRSKFFLNCGMLAYQLLCIGQNRIIDSPEQQIPKTYSISASNLSKLIGTQDKSNTGAVVFYERHMFDSERMVLAILQTARNHGAQIHNYVSATDFQKTDGIISGLKAQDELTRESFNIHSKLVINAAGPWIDELNSTLPKAKHAPSISGFAVGSHIVTRQISQQAIALTTKHQSDAKVDRGGRHIFIIPWRGYSLIGTSYDETKTPEQNLNITASHVTQLLDAVNHGLPNARLKNEDLISGYSGLYPLNTDNINSTVYQGSGEYQIIDHENANDVKGLITALGAKYTTGRKLSELTMKVVNKKLPLSGTRANQIQRCKLLGSDYTSLSTFSSEKIAQYANQLPEETTLHLIEQYGSQLDQFMQRLNKEPALLKTISDRAKDIMGQVVWAIEKEQAVSLNDVLFNRTSLGLFGIQQQEVEKVAQLMRECLEWSNQEYEKQLQTVQQKLTNTQAALSAHRH